MTFYKNSKQKWLELSDLYDTVNDKPNQGHDIDVNEKVYGFKFALKAISSNHFMTMREIEVYVCE